MFLHKLEGSWLSHPFWKTKFLLTDPEQLENLRASAVPAVVIDVSKGADVKPPEKQAEPALEVAHATAPIQPAARPVFGRAAPGPAARATPRPVSARPTAAAEIQQRAPRSIAEEIGAANTLARKSVKVMRRLFEEARLGKAMNPAVLEPMIDDISNSVQRNPHAFNAMTRLRRDNEYLYMHSLSVCALMINLAREMKLRPEQIRMAGTAGLLMDVGMAHIPQEIYDKDEGLTDEERAIVQSHTTLAHQFLMLGGDMPPEVLDVCLHHHERMDGSGYPHGLAGEAIPLFARMAAICDVYDARTSSFGRKLGHDPAEILARIGETPEHFDPDIFAAFVRSIGIYPIGSLVRLKSHRLAMVVAQSAEDFSLPRVRAFYAIDQEKFVTVEEIDLSNCYGRDHIISREDPVKWNFDDWEGLYARLLQVEGLISG
jgi:HD-GYP domain-containing protein (c-di-GMP phosphodiesterase class II)